MINPAALWDHDFGKTEQAYQPRDTILYALGLGMGSDPLDAKQLAFLDERDLHVLPTFAVTLCSPGMWIRDERFGVDFGKLVHSAQSAEFYAALPSAAQVVGEAEIISLADRGAGRGAVLTLERRISDRNSGKLYCRLHQTLLLRGDGGFGGPAEVRQGAAMPDVPPDAVIHQLISQRAALIYRLSGDWNPLHLDPAIAISAGFSRPILHGLASYGMAGHVASCALGRDPVSIARLACRFSGVVLPGDDVEFRLWKVGADAALFTAHVGDRKVLDAGEIEWRAN